MKLLHGLRTMSPAILLSCCCGCGGTVEVTCKNASSVAGDHIKQNPLWDFAPQSRHCYGFMVSGLARDGTRNVLERSNVLLYQWP